MNHQRKNNLQALDVLISEYEAMSQRGAVAPLEEADFYSIGMHFINEGNTNKAIEVLDKALQRHFLSIDLLTLKVDLLIDLKKYNIALDLLTRRMSIFPSNPQLQLLKGKILFFSKNQNTIAYLEEIKSIIDTYFLDEVYVLKGKVFQREHKYTEAFNQYKKALKLQPSNIDALQNIQFCVEILGNYDESIAFHDKLLEQDAYSLLAWYNKGRAHQCIGDYIEAYEAFTLMMAIDDKFEEAYLCCADVCVELNKVEEALQYLNEAEVLFSRKATTAEKLANCYSLIGENQRAIDHYKKAIKLDQENDTYYHKVGQCFVAMEKPKIAKSYFAKAIELNDLEENYQIALAECYEKLGDEELAWKHYSMATETAPESLVCSLRFIQFLLKINAIEQALEIIDLVELNFGFEEMEFAKVACLFAKGERKKALTILKNAIKKHPKHVETLYYLMPSLSEDQDIILFNKVFKKKK